MDPFVQEAVTIFTTIHGFVRDRASSLRRRTELDSLPQEFQAIPWRRVYKSPEQQRLITYPMMHWDAGELSFGGGGNLWCFTWLLRCGRNIIRKTEDGQTWESRHGRQQKRDHPHILVDRLVLSSGAFDMLEFTLDQTMPIVALCKIRRTQQGNNVAAGSQQDSNNVNVFSMGAWTSHVGEASRNQEGTAGSQLVQPPQGCVQEQMDHLIYKEAVSFLHRMMGKFEVVCFFSSEAHNIASLVQRAASTLRNVANRLEINEEEPESARPSTSNSTQQMGATSGAANFSAMDQRLAALGTEHHVIGDDYVDVWEELLDLVGADLSS